MIKDFKLIQLIKIEISDNDRILTSPVGVWRQSEVLGFDIETLHGKAYNEALIKQVESELEFLLLHSSDYIVHNCDGTEVPIDCFIQETREIVEF